MRVVRALSPVQAAVQSLPALRGAPKGKTVMIKSAASTLKGPQLNSPVLTSVTKVRVRACARACECGGGEASE